MGSINALKKTQSIGNKKNKYFNTPKVNFVIALHTFRRSPMKSLAQSLIQVIVENHSNSFTKLKIHGDPLCLLPVSTHLHPKVEEPVFVLITNPVAVISGQKPVPGYRKTFAPFALVFVIPFFFFQTSVCRKEKHKK